MAPKAGDEVVVLVEGQQIRGKIVGDQAGMLIITDGKITAFINKTKLGAIMTQVKEQVAEKPGAEKPAERTEVSADHFTILACANPKAGCKGVCYIKYGAGASENDFDGFMSKCPVRSPSCMRKSLGRLTNAPLSVLKESIDNTVYGEYPRAE